MKDLAMVTRCVRSLANMAALKLRAEPGTMAGIPLGEKLIGATARPSCQLMVGALVSLATHKRSRQNR